MRVASKTKYTDEALLEKIQRFVKQKGRAPQPGDICKGAGGPSYTTYRRRFGSWTGALQRAGLSVNIRPKTPASSLIKEFIKQNGRPPRVRELKPENALPSYRTICHKYGNLGKALSNMGYDSPVFGRRWNDEDLLKYLRQMAKKLGRLPTRKDITQDRDAPSHQTYYKRFGSIAKALMAAGLSDMALRRRPSEAPPDSGN